MKLVVIGVPQPQGNKTGFIQGGRVVLAEGRRPESRRAFKDWRAAIAAEARKWCLEHLNSGPIDGPVSIEATFFMPRPKGAPKRVVFPATRPDADKLARSVLDALTSIAYTDDSRIVDLVVRKRFAIDSPPRAEIEVRRVE